MIEDIFGRAAAPEGPPLLLFVCTGNICRSPLAEKVLRARLRRSPAESHGMTISSAGLHAVVGSGMDVLPAEIARRHGADSHHVAQQLTRELVESSSIILTMTRAQQSELIEEFPFALKRTFTLVELTRLLDELPSAVLPPDTESNRTLFDVAVDASRNRSAIARRPDDDIDDPYRRSDETHEQVGTRIIKQVDRLAVLLRN